MNFAPVYCKTGRPPTTMVKAIVVLRPALAYNVGGNLPDHQE